MRKSLNYFNYHSKKILSPSTKDFVGQQDHARRVAADTKAFGCACGPEG